MDSKTQKFTEEENEGYLKIDRYNEEKIASIAGHYKDILQKLGEDPEREGLIKTPERVAKALQYLTHGYDTNRKRFFVLRCLKKTIVRWLW